MVEGIYDYPSAHSSVMIAVIFLAPVDMVTRDVAIYILTGIAGLYCILFLVCTFCLCYVW